MSRAPPGPLLLHADGTTTTRPGTWPSLEFELVAVPGQDNRLQRPVYLLPLDEANQLCVDETTGGTLALPAVPGFALTVEAGAATFLDGTQAGCVSVTVVHADKVPMTPNFGQQPRFIVTIQPAGVLFDPPAPMSLPNTDGLAPGTVTELYSFDHDLGQFVALGTGTVSADGTTIASDPGVGIVKSGWASGGDPGDTGEAENVFLSFSPPPAIFLSGGPVPLSAAGGPLPGSFSWSGGNSVLSLGVSSSSSVTATPVAPGTAQISVTYTAQSGQSPPTATATVTVAEITIPDTIAVCKDQTKEIPITLNPSPLPSGATVELSLNTVAGDGAATFDDGSTSISLTQSTTVMVKAVKASAEESDNIELSASADGQVLAADRFTTLFVNVSPKITGTVSDDNDARSQYFLTNITFSLGKIITPTAVGTGIEFQGQVSPKDFTSPIKFRRDRINIREYGNGILTKSGELEDDTSKDRFRDDNPQSNGSGGTIYDLDAPGFDLVKIGNLPPEEQDPVGTTRNVRINFAQRAEFDGTLCSDVINWFTRQSIEKTAEPNTWVRDNSITGDNEFGEGSTNITLDLN